MRFQQQIIRGAMIALVSLVTLGALGLPGGDSARAYGTTAGSNGPVVARLAETASRSQGDLELVAQETELLVDGRQIVTVKALDRRAGDVVTASFVGDPADARSPVVDPVLARAEAASAWRAEHGALVPAAAAHVAAMAPEATVDVAVWLAAPLGLPLWDDVRPAPPETGSAGPPQQTAPPYWSQPGPRVPSPATSAAQKPPLPAMSLDERALKANLLPRIPDRQEELAAVEARKQVQDALLRTELAGVRAAFIDRLSRVLPEAAARYTETMRVAVAQGEGGAAVGLHILIVPDLTSQEIQALARLPGVDAVYLVPDFAGASLASAGPTQNADLANSVGYDGSGVEVAIIEGAAAFPDNPYLSIAGTYDITHVAATADREHATGVAGIVGSRHPVFRGLASGATLYSANGDYQDFNRMLNAMAWGQQQASVLNNSWYWDTINNPTFWAADRQLDVFVRDNRDFVTVAAGNFGDPVCYTDDFFTTFVVSPAKGYNVMSVGNARDQDTLAWDDDVMSRCSSYGDPGGENPSPTHAKPEVAAVGSTIESTVISTTVDGAIADIGSGTSYAAPMVAALAANLIQADPPLAARPEAIKAIIMATALRNLEGDAALSDVDGAGGVMPTAALATVERGHWASLQITSSASFPIIFTQFAHAGERVRFATTWLANATDLWASAPPDLDLRVTRQGGIFVGSSVSAHNPFEIVDYVAPASDVYTFAINLAGSWAYAPTYLGAAWWRGTYRVPPDTGFYDPPPTPLGTHLSVYPDDWSQTTGWRAFGIRPVGGDLDLVLSSASWFEDPAARSTLAVSAFPGTAMDYVAVNGRHGGGAPEHYRVRATYGSSSTYLGWSSGITGVIGAPGTYGPYEMGPAEPVKAFDLRFPLNRAQVIRVVPDDAGTDLAMELFASGYGAPETWALGRGDGVAAVDRFGAGPQSESLVYRYDGSVEDIHGLVVSNKVPVGARFTIVVADADEVWIPMVRRGTQ